MKNSEMIDMVLLIDTNVAIDYLSNRENYFEAADMVMTLCSLEKCKGYIAFHSIANMWYVFRKEPDELRRGKLKKICSILTVTGASHERVVKAINKTEFKDFEDCLQDSCAAAVNADYIITRNTKDFAHAETKAITPEYFCDKIAPLILST